MNKSKVSIIIPVHNSEKYIKKCIDSILNQTYKNIEILVVVNGSSDNSINILKGYTHQIKLINLPNPSIGNARNVGINSASGDYILFFDSDDFMESTMINDLVKKAIELNFDLITSDYYTYEETSNKKYLTKTPDFNGCNIFTKPEILYKISYGPVKLFKKEIILDNNIMFPVDLKYEDINFVAKYLIYAKKIGKVNKPLFNYVIHNNSEQTTIDKRVFDILKVMDNLIKDYQKVTNVDLTNLCVKTLLTFALKQKYQQDKFLKNKFVNETFDYLNIKFPKWRKCEYLKNEPFLKKLIKSSKFLIKIYCKIGFIK